MDCLGWYTFPIPEARGDEKVLSLLQNWIELLCDRGRDANVTIVVHRVCDLLVLHSPMKAQACVYQ